MDGNYINFRKARVGGFNKKDVISYIEKMRNDFYDYKKAVEATVDQLNAKIRELESACEEQKQEIQTPVEEAPVAPQKSNDPLADINEATNQLRMVADELCKNLSDFMSKINYEAQNCEQETAEVEETESVEAYIEEIAENILEETFEKDIQTESDRVSSILNASLNFSFCKDESTESEPICEVRTEAKKSILDSLSSSSFFN